MAEVPRDLLFRKSQALCSLFIELIDKTCQGHGLDVVTTRDSHRRGSHVSLRHKDGYPIVQALIAAGVIGDFRAPDILRFGFTPLYLRYADVWQAVDILRDLLETRGWDQAQFRTRAQVT
jgi:kynureninase